MSAALSLCCCSCSYLQVVNQARRLPATSPPRHLPTISPMYPRYLPTLR